MTALLAQLTINGIIWGALYALLGLSWNIIYGPTKIFHFQKLVSRSKQLMHFIPVLPSVISRMKKQDLF